MSAIAKWFDHCTSFYMKPKCHKKKPCRKPCCKPCKGRPCPPCPTCTCQSRSFNFDETPGDLKSYTHTFIIEGVASLTAYGFQLAGFSSPLNLYEKNDGLGETGLGLVSGDPDHEIGTQNFIQLYVKDVVDASTPFITKCGAPTITFGSVQQKEGWVLYVSNTLGAPLTSQTPVVNGSFVNPNTSPTVFTIPFPAEVLTGGFKYLSITAQGTDATPDICIIDITIPTCVGAS
jgi:hypothetical protein